MGILSFLLHWGALSGIDTETKKFSHTSPSTQSKWGLVHEFQDLTTASIENYLPQVCNILLAEKETTVSDKDEGSIESIHNVEHERMIHYLENVVLDKCDSCLPFGLKISGYLKVPQQTDGSRCPHLYVFNATSYNFLPLGLQCSFRRILLPNSWQFIL